MEEKDFSILMKEARFNKKMSLKELSELTGIDVSMLSRYENGITKNIPKLKKELISKTLDIGIVGTTISTALLGIPTALLSVFGIALSCLNDISNNITNDDLEALYKACDIIEVLNNKNVNSEVKKIIFEEIQEKYFENKLLHKNRRNKK